MSNVVAFRVQREVGHRQIVRHTLPVSQPVGVHRADGADVDEVHLLDEALDLVEPLLDVEELLHVQRGLVVQVDRVGDAAHREILDVGRLAAEERDDLVDLPLILERLEIVRDREQIDLRRQLHRRVSPVAVREDPELPAGDEPGQAILDRLELLPAVAGPRG